MDVACQWQDGLDLLKQYPYRLALLGYRMPGVTGVQLFQQMRRLDDNITGLLVTAFDSPEMERDAESAGLWQVVRKPVDLPGLLPLILKVYA